MRGRTRTRVSFQHNTTDTPEEWGYLKWGRDDTMDPISDILTSYRIHLTPRAICIQHYVFICIYINFWHNMDSSIKRTLRKYALKDSAKFKIQSIKDWRFLCWNYAKNSISHMKLISWDTPQFQNYKICICY